MYYFTSDEHFGHTNIIKFCNRPFENVHEMNRTIINNHNSIVTDQDIIIHGGDFTLNKTQYALDVIKRLNGSHIFLTGSHDRWIKKGIDLPTNVKLGGYVFEQMIEKVYIVVCHYSMRVWPRSHYGSIMLYGHSHGHLSPLKNQLDIGVDSNNFTPVSFKEVLKKVNDNEI